MPIGMTQITAFAVIILILTIGSLMSSNNALIEQVVKAQNMTANTTDLYLDNMSQFDDSGRISSREPIACPMC
jgi:ABC-type polysaccharide transport system permease subunit